MPRPTEFTFTYRDLVRLSAMSQNTLYQQVRRGNLDPADLQSVLLFLARHGKIGLRLRIVHAALLRGLPAVSGQRPAGRKPGGRTRRRP